MGGTGRGHWTLIILLMNTDVTSVPETFPFMVEHTPHSSINFVETVELTGLSPRISTID